MLLGKRWVRWRSKGAREQNRTFVFSLDNVPGLLPEFAFWNVDRMGARVFHVNPRRNGALLFHTNVFLQLLYNCT